MLLLMPQEPPQNNSSQIFASLDYLVVLEKIRHQPHRFSSSAMFSCGSRKIKPVLFLFR